MKRLIIILIAFVSLTAASQQFKRTYFLSDFTDGILRYKGGQLVSAKMNYDANNQVFLFMNGDVMMEMTNAYLVDTVYVADRKFVYRAKDSDPNEGIFCEVVHVNNNKEVLIGWLIKQVYGGRTGAFGLPTQAQVIKLKAVDLIGAENGHNMNAGMGVSQYDYRNADLEVWRQKNSNTYYFKTESGEEVSAKSMKDLYKIYPERKDEIKKYAKKNKLDMMHTDRALKLIDYIINNPAPATSEE